MSCVTQGLTRDAREISHRGSLARALSKSEGKKIMREKS